MALPTIASNDNYIRPSVFAAAANDNVVKVSSDMLKLAISDFSSFLSKTNDSFADLRKSSEKTVDGFKAVIRDLTNLEKNIRFKFTYLRKEIESSRNDFLAALKAISFDFAGGGIGGEAEPFGPGVAGKGIDLPSGPPVIPPVIPDTRKPKPKTPPQTRTPTQEPNKPRTTTPRTPQQTRTAQQTRTPTQEPNKPKPPGKPQRVPRNAPPINLEIPGKPTARVSMAWEPSKTGVSGKNIGSLSGTGTGRFGLTGPGYGNVTTNVPGRTPPAVAPGTPQKMTPKVKAAFKAATENTLKIAKGVLGFDGGIANKVMSGLGAVMAVATVSSAFMRHYEAMSRPPDQRNDKEIEDTRKDFYISIFDALGTYLGANVGAMVGNLIPVPVVGSLIGGLAGAEAGGILGRSLGRKVVKGEDFFEALKDEVYKVAKEKQVSTEELEEIRNARIASARRLGGNRERTETGLIPGAELLTDLQLVERINKNQELIDEYRKYLATEEGKKNKGKGSAWWYRNVKSPDYGVGDDNATNFSFESQTQRSALNPMSWIKGRDTTETVNIRQGPAAGGRGGPAEPDLKGSGLEYQSRQTDSMNFNMMQMQMQNMQPEVYNNNQSEEYSDDLPNHPTGPISALPTANELGGQGIGDFIKWCTNQRAAAPTASA